jgi:hypothetical protein
MDSLHFKNIPLRDVLLVTQRNMPDYGVIGGLTLLISVPAKAGEQTSHTHRISVSRATHGNHLRVTTERM